MVTEKRDKVVPQRLSREAYHALENVVGKEWVCEDRAIIESYVVHCIDIGAALGLLSRSATMRFAAVVLPATTEEVQGVVRVANRYGFQITPWANAQTNTRPTVPGMVAVSLNRMNKCRVDAENLRMTIQPNVDYTSIHHEASKRGLWLGGSGWHGCIAKPCSQYSTYGLWQSDLKYLGLARNCLGLKVVRPDGSLLRLGSSAIAGTGEVPFTERVPGPNLMGMMKQSMGTRGIITEATLKLHPWVGGYPFPEDRGRPSIEHYFEEAKEKKFDRPPIFPRHKIFWFEYPDLKSMEKAMLRLARSGVGIALNVTGEYNTLMCSYTIAEANERSKGFFHFMGYIVVAGISSERQLAYEEKVVRHIVEQTGGKLLSPEYKPELLDAQSNWNVEFVLNTETGMRTVRSNYIGVVLPTQSPFSQITDAAALWSDGLRDVGTIGEERGEYFTTMPGKCPYVYVVDRGHQLTTEEDMFPERNNMDEVRQTFRMVMYEWFHFLANDKYGQSIMVDAGEPLQSVSPEVGPDRYRVWRKLKKAVDPNRVFVTGRMEYSAERFKEVSKKPAPLLQMILDTREKLGMPKLELNEEGDGWRPAEQ